MEPQATDAAAQRALYGRRHDVRQERRRATARLRGEGGQPPSDTWMRTRHPEAPGGAGVVGTPASDGAVRPRAKESPAGVVARYEASRPLCGLPSPYARASADASQRAAGREAAEGRCWSSG